VTGSFSITSNASNSPSLITVSGTGVQPPVHSASLNWTRSATPTVMGYNVYRATLSGGPYVKVNSPLDATATFSDTTVQAGLTYFWVVTAVDSTNA
jgi:fibronectin type 3 domain-containing protein